MDFSNKCVVVTGSSSGIGKATALTFAKRGASVLLHGRNEERLQEAVNECKKIGKQDAKFPSVIGDIDNDEVLKKIVASVTEQFGRIDVLVNNAGIVIADDLLPGNIAALESQFNVLLRAPMLLSQLCFPLLEKCQGNIVNVSSIGSTRPSTGCPYYCIAKSGLDMFTKCAALEYGEKGVRVNAINPCYVPTNIARSSGMVSTDEELETFANTLKTRSPLKKNLTAEEMAKMIVYLASDDASMMNGHCLVHDGGPLRANTLKEKQVFREGESTMYRVLFAICIVALCNCGTSEARAINYPTESFVEGINDLVPLGGAGREVKIGETITADFPESMGIKPAKPTGIHVTTKLVACSLSIGVLVILIEALSMFIQSNCKIQDKSLGDIERGRIWKTKTFRNRRPLNRARRFKDQSSQSQTFKIGAVYDSNKVTSNENNNNSMSSSTDTVHDGSKKLNERYLDYLEYVALDSNATVLINKFSSIEDNESATEHGLLRKRKSKEALSVPTNDKHGNMYTQDSESFCKPDLHPLQTSTSSPKSNALNITEYKANKAPGEELPGPPNIRLVNNNLTVGDRQLTTKELKSATDERPLSGLDYAFLSHVSYVPSPRTRATSKKGYSHHCHVEMNI